MTNDRDTFIRWRKVCRCEGSSATGRVRIEEVGRTEDAVNFRVTMVPTMTCEVCGTPWERVDAE